MVEEKYIGLGLAVSGSVLIGTSFIITKKGLIDAAERHGSYSTGESYDYLRNVIWWAGMVTMIVGEVANFAAYTFAPPILVTPLGALSVLIGAILASIFLKEELGRIGRVGCTLCLLGSLIIVLHAPEDKEVTTVDEMLNYAMQPAFMLYALCVTIFSLYMIYVVSPRYGTRNPLVYLSICSVVGSVSVMAIKGFGVAIKLTFAGNNQLTHLPTYIFGLVTAGCIVVQMERVALCWLLCITLTSAQNYFNKALDLFSTNVVNPLYYVGFTTSTIVASLILFQGIGTESGVNAVSLIAGFVVIFLGVYLLNISRADPHGTTFNDPTAHRHSLLETRMSMSGHNRLSLDTSSQHHLPLSARRPRTASHHSNEGGGISPSHAKRASVIFDDTAEANEGLPILGEASDESDEELESGRRRPPSYHSSNGRTGGTTRGSEERHPALEAQRVGGKR